MDNNYLVYVHTTPSNKRYVGMTSNDAQVRWKYGYGYENQIFCEAIKKYGWDKTQHEIVAQNLSKDEAEKMEQKLISEYRTNDCRYGYNLTLGGLGSLGRVCSEITKRKISIANTGRIPSDATRRMWSEQRKGKCFKSNKGKNNPMYGRLGENNPNYGRHHSEETLIKMRGQKRSEETKERMRIAWQKRREKTKSSNALF